jgi:hypothetical protein
MWSQYIRSIDTKLNGEEDMFTWLVGGHLMQKLKAYNTSTRSGIKNQMSGNKYITHKNRRQMQSLSKI